MTLPSLRPHAMLAALLLLCGAATAKDASPASGQITLTVKPSQTDAAIQRFDEPHYVAFNGKASDKANLVVFMPGTQGMPSNLVPLLRAVADMGYQVIGLQYNNSPAVVQICKPNPDPECSGDFRQERIFGDDASPVIDNTAAESIVHRLTALLRHLDQRHPNQHWRQYLEGNAPNWSRIVVSGLSQGAGMAAYIAKKKPVARVVLFSSPWDFYGINDKKGKLAPWLLESSATPPERWFAAYHRREATAALLAKSYMALKIPEAHVRVFDAELSNGAAASKNPNPFHGDGVRNPVYATDWSFLFASEAL